MENVENIAANSDDMVSRLNQLCANGTLSAIVAESHHVGKTLLETKSEPVGVQVLLKLERSACLLQREILYLLKLANFG